MRKSRITIGLAAASLAAIAGLTACGTAAAATSGHPAAPASHPAAALPTADSILARGYWRSITEIALNPGMAKSGIVTVASGVSYQATDGRGSGTQDEEVAVVYRTAAEARAWRRLLPRLRRGARPDRPARPRPRLPGRRRHLPDHRVRRRHRQRVDRRPR